MRSAFPSATNFSSTGSTISTRSSGSATFFKSRRPLGRAPFRFDVTFACAAGRSVSASRSSSASFVANSNSSWVVSTRSAFATKMRRFKSSNSSRSRSCEARSKSLSRISSSTRSCSTASAASSSAMRLAGVVLAVCVVASIDDDSTNTHTAVDLFLAPAVSIFQCTRSRRAGRGGFGSTSRPSSRSSKAPSSMTTEVARSSRGIGRRKTPLSRRL